MFSAIFSNSCLHLPSHHGSAGITDIGTTLSAFPVGAGDPNSDVSDCTASDFLTKPSPCPLADSYRRVGLMVSSSTLAAYLRFVGKIKGEQKPCLGWGKATQLSTYLACVDPGFHPQHGILWLWGYMYLPSMWGPWVSSTTRHTLAVGYIAAIPSIWEVAVGKSGVQGSS